MYNQFDVGMVEDFDNMTKDLGRKVWVYPRSYVLTHEGQDGSESDTGMGTAALEIVFLQELDSEHEMVSAGQMDVGDVRFTFQSTSTVEEESFVTPDEGTTIYKVLKLTKVRNMSNNRVTYIKAFGKKLPKR